MIEAIESNSTDRSVFWRHLKKCCTPSGSKVLAIKNKAGKVIYEIKDILEVWKSHLVSLSTPRDDPSYDNDHFIYVNKEVDEYNKMDDGSAFSDTPYSTCEVQKAINKLHMKKAYGFDGI